MTALSHTLMHLARLRWLGVAFCTLAMLCSTTHSSALTGATTNDRVNATAVTAATASANEREQAKTRVGGFHQNSPLNVCANALASTETHRGISSAQRETASAFSHAAEGGGTFEAIEQEATGFLGHSGFELTNLQGTLNSAETIGDCMFTGHALDMMQARGFVPSVVENAIQTGGQFSGNTVGTMGYFDATNNLLLLLTCTPNKNPSSQ